MGILSNAIEQRSTKYSGAHPRDPVLSSWLGGGVNTASGIAVTPDSAMREAAVYTCVRVLAESVAQLPLHVYRRRKNGSGKDKADGHPLYDLLHSKPNRNQTSFEFREYLMAVVGLRGNFVSRIDPLGGRAVGELIPLEPDRTEIYRDSTGKRAFRYTPERGGTETLLSDEVFYVSGMSVDGISGLSPIAYHKETVGASLAIKEFGSRLFKNGTHIGTFFEMDGSLSKEARDRLKRDLEQNWSGVLNTNKTVLLEEGMKVGKLGMTSSDAQYLESRKFSRTEIAGIYRVPPHKIGDLERATFSNIEQQAIEFVTDSLMPWLIRIEQAILRDLFSEQDRRRGYFAEFNVNALLRGDADARSKYYKARFETGSITPNEIRHYENENPQEGGDKTYVPLNMIPSEQAGRPDSKNSRFMELLRRFVAEEKDDGTGTKDD